MYSSKFPQNHQPPEMLQLLQPHAYQQQLYILYLQWQQQTWSSLSLHIIHWTSQFTQNYFKQSFLLVLCILCFSWHQHIKSLSMHCFSSLSVGSKLLLSHARWLQLSEIYGSEKFTVLFYSKDHSQNIHLSLVGDTKIFSLPTQKPQDTLKEENITRHLKKEEEQRLCQIIFILVITFQPALMNKFFWKETDCYVNVLQILSMQIKAMIP